jgi:hypothetical protein
MHSYICVRSPLIYSNFHESMSIFENDDFHWSLKLNKGILLSTGHAVIAHKLYDLLRFIVERRDWLITYKRWVPTHIAYINRIRNKTW